MKQTSAWTVATVALMFVVALLLIVTLFPVGGWGMMGGGMAAMMAFFMLIPFAFLAFLLLGIVWLVRSLSQPAASSLGRTCPGCGRSVQADWKVCPHCGTSLA